MQGPRVALAHQRPQPGDVRAAAALTTAGLVAVERPFRLDWRSTPDDYGAAVRSALADDGVDAVMVVHAPPLAHAVAAPVAAIDEAAAGATKPVVAVLMGGANGPLRRGSPVPAFAFPEPAAAVLGRSHAYGTWLQQEAGAETAGVADIDRATVAGVIADALGAGRHDDWTRPRWWRCSPATAWPCLRRSAVRPPRPLPRPSSSATRSP